MKAQAPGKVVLVGAYSVLEQAPAIVVAVDRFAIADTSVRGEGATAELRAAFPSDDAPTVDLRAFTGAHGKLGLGGSAAALVSALFATGETDPWRIFRRARRMHGEVQRGGSGIDVAASVFGGIHAYQLAATSDADPVVTPLALPTGLHVRVYVVPKSARTSELLARVAELKSSDEKLYRARMRGLSTASADAVTAAKNDDLAHFCGSCRVFGTALAALGKATGAPIFLPEVAALADLVPPEEGSFYPAGAGGGDIAVYVADRAPSEAFVDLAAKSGIELLDVVLGAPAAHVITTG